MCYSDRGLAKVAAGDQPKSPMILASSSKRALINILISFNLLAILVWVFPINPPLFQKIRKTIGPYMQLSGLVQGWEFFAPEPQSINAFLVGEITYRDGQKKKWKFPVPQDFGYYRRYFMARQLRWSVDSLRLDSNEALWPDAARYVARLNDNPKNPPVTVTFVRNWSYIAPPMSGQPEPLNQYTFFTYAVLQSDLL
jgi:hypothetical protein